MTAQPIRQYGDPVLATPAADVVDFDDDLRTLVLDLWETMERAGGVGLAAPQIGVSLRVFVYHCEGWSGHVVNPRTTVIGDDVVEKVEGCLSIPGRHHHCQRGVHAVTHGRNLLGDHLEVQGIRMLARVLQHETDHLDGVLYLDHLDPDARHEAERVLAGGVPERPEPRRRGVMSRRWRRETRTLGEVH